MKNKHLPFTVPDGYFENLPERLVQRCSEHEAACAQRVSLWGSIRAQLAFAAGFALLAGLSYMAVRLAPRLAQVQVDAPYASFGIDMLDLESYLLLNTDSDDESGLDNESGLDDEAIMDYLLCDSQIQIAMAMEAEN
ncbi:MAG: hypothetical protein LBJ57_02255 [Prevotellaceae bacterium]|jgi:hypothetical protein|nr:hypothetical protein [Prevotellaceae bacterium]